MNLSVILSAYTMFMIEDLYQHKSIEPLVILGFIGQYQMIITLLMFNFLSMNIIHTPLFGFMMKFY